MPRAGFTAIASGTIRFGMDGHWYCDDERITNPAICRLYARAMTVDPDGTARLELGEDRAVVVVEDTPWVVRRVDGDPGTGFRITLNDGSVWPLDVTTLDIGAGHVLYCRARNGVRVRFLRSPQYELLAHAEADPDGPLLRARGGTVRLGPAE